MALPHPPELRGIVAGVQFHARGTRPWLPGLRLRRGVQCLGPVCELQRQFLPAVGAGDVQHDGFRHSPWQRDHIITVDVLTTRRGAFRFSLAEFSIPSRTPPVLFEMAATRLGVASSGIWFVGDRLDADVVGANAVGMTSVMLGTRAPSAPVTDKPSISIADWQAWPRWT